jgi:GTP cyclohydrolase I
MATALATGRDELERARAAVEQLLLAIGEDPSREGLLRTPERVAKSLAFLNSGATKGARDVLNGAIFSESYRGLVLVQDVEFYSLCEHHMLPFSGRAHIAYLPQGKVIGLSKLPRLLDVFARRLQVQERLNGQVAAAVHEAIRPRGVAVMLEAVHFCMMMRGVEKQDSKTITTAWLGAFERDASLRQEFLASVRGVAAERSHRGPRELREVRAMGSRAPGAAQGLLPAPVVAYPGFSEEARVGVFPGRPRSNRKGGTYPRRQAILAPGARPARDDGDPR